MAKSSLTFSLKTRGLRRGLHALVPCLALTGLCWPAAAAEPASGTAIAAGDSVRILQLWPTASQASWEDLATIEFWIRPDRAAVARPGINLICFSNQAGSDVVSVGVSCQEGVVRAIVLATYFDSKTKLPADRWTHVALTMNSKTINPQVKLWINGKLAAEQLVLNTWPMAFQIAEMLSDHWNQGREFSGQLGDVRISRVVRYQQDFAPNAQLSEDDDTSLLLKGDQVPLGR